MGKSIKVRGKFRHLTFSDRVKIEVLLKEGRSIKYIADYLGFHRSTIYREIKKGEYEGLKSDLTTEKRYSPDIAEEKHKINLSAQGAQMKLGKDFKYAVFLEKMILENDYSPAAVLGYIKTHDMENDFSVSICVTTFYSYIDKGVFLNLSNKDLPVKCNKKRRYKRVKKNRARAASGRSIEQRPEIVDNREEFGHWEMDTVVGKRGKSKKSLLVLTERKTREELIFLLNEHTASAVVEKIDLLEVKFGSNFSSVFKTITCDNGTEFSYVEELEMSKLINDKRTELFYCHPYTSCERGSNEVTNKMIRRKIPKGINFDDKTDEDIMIIQNWINTYPRKLHDYYSASDVLNEELKLCGMADLITLFE